MDAEKSNSGVELQYLQRVNEVKKTIDVKNNENINRKVSIKPIDIVKINTDKKDLSSINTENKVAKSASASIKDKSLNGVKKIPVLTVNTTSNKEEFNSKPEIDTKERINGQPISISSIKENIIVSPGLEIEEKKDSSINQSSKVVISQISTIKASSRPAIELKPKSKSKLEESNNTLEVIPTPSSLIITSDNKIEDPAPEVIKEEILELPAPANTDVNKEEKSASKKEKQNGPNKLILTSPDDDYDDDYTHKYDKFKWIRRGIYTALILLIAGVGFYYMDKLIFWDKNFSSNQQAVPYFLVQDNSNTSRFLSIVTPSTDVSVDYVSRVYYGDDKYAYYIKKANEDVVENGNIIKKGQLIKIPVLGLDAVAAAEAGTGNTMK